MALWRVDLRVPYTHTDWEPETYWVEASDREAAEDAACDLADDGSEDEVPKILVAVPDPSEAYRRRIAALEAEGQLRLPLEGSDG